MSIDFFCQPTTDSHLHNGLTYVIKSSTQSTVAVFFYIICLCDVYTTFITVLVPSPSIVRRPFFHKTVIYPQTSLFEFALKLFFFV